MSNVSGNNTVMHLSTKNGFSSTWNMSMQNDFRYSQRRLPNRLNIGSMIWRIVIYIFKIYTILMQQIRQQLKKNHFWQPFCLAINNNKVYFWEIYKIRKYQDSALCHKTLTHILIKNRSKIINLIYNAEM